MAVIFLILQIGTTIGLLQSFSLTEMWLQKVTFKAANYYLLARKIVQINQFAQEAMPNFQIRNQVPISYFINRKVTSLMVLEQSQTKILVLLLLEVQIQLLCKLLVIVDLVMQKFVRAVQLCYFLGLISKIASYFLRLADLTVIQIQMSWRRKDQAHHSQHHQACYLEMGYLNYTIIRKDS